MTISYPVNLPSTTAIKRLRWTQSSVVGVSKSPFTFSRQTYVHQGEMWSADVELVPMIRADAEAWLAWLLSLNGVQGTFLMGDVHGATARGTWSGTSPVVAGASQTGKTLAVDGVTAFATAKAGDWFQLGSGSSSRLHKLTADVTFDSGGSATLDFWPRLRSSPADNAALTIASAKGLFALAANENSWDVEEIIYGLRFSAEEVL